MFSKYLETLIELRLRSKKYIRFIASEMQIWQHQELAAKTFSRWPTNLQPLGTSPGSTTGIENLAAAARATLPAAKRPHWEPQWDQKI